METGYTRRCNRLNQQIIVILKNYGGIETDHSCQKTYTSEEVDASVAAHVRSTSTVSGSVSARSLKTVKIGRFSTGIDMSRKHSHELSC